MSDLDLKTSGFFILALCVAAIILLATNLPGDNHLIFSLQDSGHFLIFTLLTLAVLWSYRKAEKSNIWSVMMLCLLFGVLIEGVQYLIGRESSLFDVMMDLLGIAAGAMLYLGFIKRSFSPGLSATAATLLATAAFSMPIFWLITYQARAAEFPQLINTDSFVAHALIEGNQGGVIRRVTVADDWQNPAETEITSCIHVSLAGGRWPGVSMTEPEPDWRGYELLELTIYSDQAEDLPLTLRIHDKNHNNQYQDRYHNRLTLHPGFNRFTLPLNEIEHAPSARRMDLSAISKITLFASSDYVGKDFCLLSMGLK